MSFDKNSVLPINVKKVINDITRAVIGGGDLTFATQNPAFSYLVVYHLEILLLFFTLVLLGPLSQYLSSLKIEGKSTDRFGFSEMPIGLESCLTKIEASSPDRTFSRSAKPY